MTMPKIDLGEWLDDACGECWRKCKILNTTMSNETMDCICESCIANYRGW